MKETLKSIELESVNRARKIIGKKPLDEIKIKRYKSYLKDFEKRRYSVELLRFQLGK